MLVTLSVMLIAIAIVAIVLSAIFMVFVVKIALLCVVGLVLYRAFIRRSEGYRYQQDITDVIKPARQAVQSVGRNTFRFVLGLGLALYLVSGIRYSPAPANDELMVAQISDDTISESIRARVKLAAERGQEAVKELRSKMAMRRDKNEVRQKSEKPARTYHLKSQPCGTAEKAKLELADKLRETIRYEISPDGLVDLPVVDQALKLLAIKPEIKTEYKEVAGEKYPVYTAFADVNVNADFQEKLQKAMRLGIMAEAKSRVNLLFDLSVVAVVGLGLGNLVLKRTGRRGDG